MLGDHESGERSPPAWPQDTVDRFIGTKHGTQNLTLVDVFAGPSTLTLLPSSGSLITVTRNINAIAYGKYKL